MHSSMIYYTTVQETIVQDDIFHLVETAGTYLLRRSNAAEPLARLWWPELGLQGSSECGFSGLWGLGFRV